MRIWSSWPRLSNRFCAVARSKPAIVAPPMDETAPKLTSPEMRNCRTGPRDCTPICWPTAKSFLSAVPWSTTTSPGFGQAPDTRVRVLNSGLRRVDAEAEVGRPAEGDRLAVMADQVGVTGDLADGRLHVGQAP